MYIHLIHRSLGLRKYSCDSKGDQNPESWSEDNDLFNKIWQMALGFAAIFQQALAMCQPPCKKAVFSIPQGISGCKSI